MMKARQSTPLKAEARTIELPDAETIRFAVVADTHSQPHSRAHAELQRRGPDFIMHAGDIGDLIVLDELAAIAKLIAIRGNIDEHAPELCDELRLELVRGGKIVLRVLLTHIGVYGPRLQAQVKKRALEHQAQIVVCGHSHVPLIARDGELIIFNPGSIGPRRFQLPITFGMLTLDRGRVTMEHIDCESGEKWSPP